MLGLADMTAALHCVNITPCFVTRLHGALILALPDGRDSDTDRQERESGGRNIKRQKQINPPLAACVCARMHVCACYRLCGGNLYRRQTIWNLKY